MEPRSLTSDAFLKKNGNKYSDSTENKPYKRFQGLPLSPYATFQCKALKMVDTITIDPHKSGFCVFPSGGLCYRNSSLRNFITLAGPADYHVITTHPLGCLESRALSQEAAAASVFLSHKVSCR